jgi:hypothetical protein
MVQYELLKKALPIKGSIVECGVYEGAGVMSWAKISEILEPYNFKRKVVGFDTFSGFPDVHSSDCVSDEFREIAKVGHLSPSYDTFSEIQNCIAEFNETRLLKHQEKVILVKGNAMETIPEFLTKHPYMLVSLLYLDFDLYEPTLCALKNILPRMPKGSVIAFDELHDQKWPGETKALLEVLNINNYKLEHFSFEPHISYIIL